MFKELIISIVIIISIFSLDMFTQNYTEKSVERITEQFSNLKKYISDDNAENIQNTIKNIDDDWEKIHDKLAYYIEHDELEKVETNLTSLKSYIETNEYAEAVSELDKSVFILKHIEDKYVFNLQNVF